MKFDTSAGGEHKCSANRRLVLASPTQISTNWSEGFALTGYDIPGCVDDGAWMPWENSSAVAVAAVAHPGLGKLVEFHYGIGPSGVRGSIRLVFRSTDARVLLFCPCKKN